MRSLIYSLLLAFVAVPAANAGKTENVVLVLLDGVRWEEIYRGVDPRFLQPDARSYFASAARQEQLRAELWADEVRRRRERLLPFMWKTISPQGQLYGSRDRGSRVDLANAFHLSYPGHAEMLTGIADPTLRRNVPVDNPNVTLLEYLQGLPDFRNRVVALSSWELYPNVINTRRSGVAVHSPASNFSLPGQPVFEMLRDFVQLMPRGGHEDLVTYHLAMEYLRTHRPRFTHIVYSVADRSAHAGHYDEYVVALRSADLFLERLWLWLQAQPDYAGKTTLLITTDHGRGSASLEAFKYHGTPDYYGWDATAPDLTEGDQFAWLAALGPDTAPLGEIAGGAPIMLTQVAATAAELLNVRFRQDLGSDRIAPPIAAVSGRE